MEATPKRRPAPRPPWCRSRGARSLQGFFLGLFVSCVVFVMVVILFGMYFSSERAHSSSLQMPILGDPAYDMRLMEAPVLKGLCLF